MSRTLIQTASPARGVLADPLPVTLLKLEAAGLNITPLVQAARYLANHNAISRRGIHNTRMMGPWRDRFRGAANVISEKIRHAGRFGEKVKEKTAGRRCWKRQVPLVKCLHCRTRNDRLRVYWVDRNA